MLMLVALPAFSQTRRRSTQGRRPARPSASAPAAASTQAAEVRAGAERIAIQLQNLTRFIYLFGRLSNFVEASEQIQKQGAVKSSEVEQLEKTKSGLREGVRNMRAGLTDLESYFESTPAVRRFYPNVVGVVDGAAAAEQFVAAGQYDQAGRSLLGVANKLADALLNIR